MQTKVYFSGTIKNCICAHIGTPTYWLLLDDLKWETWKNGYWYHKCVKNRVLQVKGNTSWDLSESEKQEVMERYVICFSETLITVSVIFGQGWPGADSVHVGVVKHKRYLILMTKITYSAYTDGLHLTFIDQPPSKLLNFLIVSLWLVNIFWS